MSGDSGAIVGDDGERYRFVRSDWKSERDPRPGEAVDFVTGTDGEASEIYPLRAGSSGADFGAVMQSGSASLSKLTESEGAAKVMNRLIASPGLSIAVLVLLVSLLFNYVVISLGGQESSTSLISYSFGGSSELSELADYARDRADNTWLMTNSDRETLRGVAALFDVLSYLAFTLLLVPAFAGWTAWKGFNGKSTRGPEIAMVAAIAWAVFYFLFAQEMLVAQVETLRNFISAEAMREGWTMGLGGYLLVLLAVLSIANIMGKLRAPLVAAEQPE